MVFQKDKLIFIILIYLISTRFGYAQFKNYSTQDGMCFHTIDHISEDDEGLIYLSTPEGLNIYDGKTFELFNELNTPEFSNDINLSLSGDKGLVLVGSDDKGLFLLNKYKQTIVPLTYTNTILNKIKSITALYLDENKTVWVGSGDGSLFSFPLSEINIEITNTPKISATLVLQHHDAIYSILETKNYILISGENPSISRIKKTDINFVIDHPIVIEAATSIYCMKIVNNSLLIGTNIGLYKIDDYDNLGKQTSQELKKAWILKNKLVRTLSIFEQQIWVGTEGNGLFKFLNNGTLLESFYYSEEKQKSLHSNYIIHSFIDSNNNLWAGTWFGGVDVLDLNESKFSFIYDQHNEKDIFSNIIWTIEKTEDNRYFLGTQGNGLCEYFPDKKYYTTIQSDNNTRTTLSLYYDPVTKLLYMGTWAHGLKIYNTKTNKLLKENTTLKLLDNDRIYSITKGPDNFLWIGTFKNGLYRYSSTKNHLEKIPLSKDPALNNMKIRCILSDNESNEIWVGTEKKGLHHIKLTNSGEILEIKQVQEQPYSKEKIRGVRNISRDQFGDIWVLLENGRGVFKINDSSQKASIKKSNVNTDVFTDNIHNLWVGSYKGLFTVDFKTKNTTTILPNLTIYDLYHDPKNEFILAAYNGGLVEIDLKHPELEPLFPKIMVSNLKVLDQLVFPNQKIKNKIILNKKLSYNDTIVLPHFSDTFSINLSTLSFSGGNKHKIRYKLKGFEKSWKEANGHATVSYNNMPSGTFILEVQAANKFGIWDKNITTLTLIKERPWWGSFWAYLFYILTAVFIIYFIYRVLNIRFKLKQTLKIEKIRHEQELELNEQKLAFFTNISHDIRTPLTLILGPLEEIIESNQVEKHIQLRLQTMLQNSRMLFNLVNQILNFRKAATENLALNLKKIDLNAFIQNAYYQFNELAQTKKIDLELSLSNDKITLLADPDKLESILFNLLSNAIKFTPKYGNIFIQVYQEDTSIYISIKDTGIGISQDEIKNLFTRFYRNKNNKQSGTGIGLSLTKTYIDLHRGNISVNSTIDVGTEFIVQFQIEKNDASYDEFTLPDNKNSKPTPILSIEDTKKKQKPSILVVDDNEQIQEYLVEILKKDYRVFTAFNGKEALQFTHKKIPDLIISDVMMDEMNGLELCERIKTNINTSHIPVILLTAKHSMESKLMGFEKGADAYIEKPFNSNLLLTRVKKIIEHRALLKKKFLLTDSLSSTDVPTSVDEEFIKMIISYIEANLDNPHFSVKNLTEKVNLSQDQLYRKLKGITSLTINQFIRLVRIKKAARLLKEERYTISEVLYMVGYSNPSYFTKCFKDEFGVSPSEYIKDLN